MMRSTDHSTGIRSNSLTSTWWKFRFILMDSSSMVWNLWLLTIPIHFTYVHSAHFLPDLGNNLRTKQMVFRGISRSTYPHGNALYIFDLSTDLAELDHFNLQKQGSVRLVLKFRQALVDNVSVIAYVEFENLIEIDCNHNVIYDFSVSIRSTWIY